ncbi:polysaccharide biosynthesis protein capd [Nitritalea halalkaliphila LW7]|uniref:Polysaccharide biosynthesis protein capd n=1 Tax=Nitritalea halalkaliphila LW7 TaxID=1189621 RepID=I5BT68_9BACT|nr:nucleoside-diphosphate sugar epimerase/dehydratase [Nitritalea halalkaliphila]EIM72770.1 polysaccharide biosynthesis protein capd [Nitritalea halalkaliphila LW7]
MTQIKLLNGVRIMPRWLIILIDTFLLGVATILAYLLRFNFDILRISELHMFSGVAVFIGLSLPAMYVCKSYGGIVRHTGLRDLTRIGCMLIGTLLTLAVTAEFMLRTGLMGKNLFLPYSVALIASFISLSLLVGYRLLIRNAFHYAKKSASLSNRDIPVLLYGAGDAAMITCQTITRDSFSPYQIVGFLDDEPDKQGKILLGYPIFKGGTEALPQLVEKKGVKELIIAITALPVERLRELTDAALALNLKVKKIPSSVSWFEQKPLKTSDIKSVRIEDLLPRKSIQLNEGNVASFVKGKRILVTGAAGSIGSEICRQLMRFGFSELLLLDQAESPLYDVQQELKLAAPDKTCRYVVADIRNRQVMQRHFKDFRPEVVFHAAAYKHVPLMEEYPHQAIQTNVKGTQILADLSLEYAVEKFVMISTDKAVNPTNVMGASKRLAEMYVQALGQRVRADAAVHTRFITTRFGNVLGSNGSVIPLFRRQLEQGGPLTVTHPDITRYFMTIPEACQLVLEAGAMGQGGEIFVFDMGQPVKIADLAKKMIRLSGKTVEEVGIVFSGLRPGEKLYEELLNDSEATLPTHHQKIKIARVKTLDYRILREGLLLLYGTVQKGDDFDQVMQMKVLVPEFISNSSRFSRLDAKVLN